MLLKLIRETQPRVQHSVISLKGRGTVGSQIEAAGARVISLNLSSVWQSVLALFRLRTLLGELQPDLIQGWMHHGNVASSAAKLLWGSRIPVAWSIRCTINIFEERLRTKLLVRASPALSAAAELIIYNSTPARTQHEAIGYAKRGIVLGNGFDVRPAVADASLRKDMRRKFAIPEDRVVIGYVGRLARIKDLPTFFAAMAQLARMRPEITIMAIGRDLPRAPALVPEIRPDVEALGDRLLLLPEQTDILPFYRMLDVFVLSSLAEGFPNVIGEAMACGVPCVSTDAGDCRTIIGDTGRVVPIRTPSALADAICGLLDLTPQTRAEIGLHARRRIEGNFSIGSIARAYETEWRRLVKAG